MNVGIKVSVLWLVAMLLPVASPHGAGSAFGSPVTRGTTCFDEVATIVGTPDTELLEGTGGADVIVTNGAIEVAAYEGDDLVCVTGKAPPPGASIVLGPGSDRLLGNPSGDDYVYADDETEGEIDRDIIFTGGGDDYVATGSQKRGASASQDQIELGGGRDHLNLNGPVSLEATSAGGSGRDLIYWPAIAPRGVAVAIDNVGEELRLNDEVVMDWDGFEIFRALPGIQGPFTFRGSNQRETLGGPVFFVEDRWKVVVRMGGGRDWVTLVVTGAGAGTQIDGGGGADRLVAHSLESAVVGSGVAMYGRAGNDRLVGSDRSDRLRGGRGRDVADGRDGADQCRAEVRTRCEF